MKRVFLPALLVSLALVSAVESRADDLLRIGLAMGEFDIGDNKQGVPELGLQGQFAPIPCKLGRLTLDVRPMVGFAANEEDGHWFYAGARSDMPVGPSWFLDLGFAVAYYDRGEGFHLGSELQFRSSIELSRKLWERYRLGIELYHLSNGGIYDKNPGSESLVLTFSAPFPR